MISVSTEERQVTVSVATETKTVNPPAVSTEAGTLSPPALTVPAAPAISVRVVNSDAPTVIEDDPSPTLGGDLNLNGYTILGLLDCGLF